MSSVRRLMATLSSSSSSLWKNGLSLRSTQSTSIVRSPALLGYRRTFRRSFVVASSSFDNDNREFVIVGGGNAAGYAARTFVEHGMADGRLCIVSKEAYAPYERPALTKAYLFPLDKKPARLPGFHTCVGSGGERQTPEWYQEKGIETIYNEPVTSIDIEKHTLTTNSGKLLKYGSLIVATGCTASRFPEKIGGNLPGVHYIRDVADADALISSLEKAKKVVIVGGGYIGMEVAAAAVAWKLDTTVIIGIGAKPAVGPFESVGLNTTVGGIQLYDRIARVEHVDHARRSAQHCVKGLLSAQTHNYDYLPYFYSRVFEYEGSSRKVWWQFFGDNVGEAIEVGNFDPKIATFWIESGKLKGVLLESGSPEEFQLLPELARSQPIVDKDKLENASSVEEALDIARSSLQVKASV
ncbi:hypothetical protein G4B88_014871 [Cannabis sativa]|uniref:monodehydroascorbate reductase (NADH) n=1 Tax=Cannabis sativa TaxID=3483 RepID=A0A7J6IB60_CANSA|nr:hypothetical protein G4B88_014871 [Cannabis sativa]